MGRRNYRHFFFFVTGCSILSVWIFAFSIVQLDLAMREGGDFVAVIGKYPASIALIVYAFFIGLSLSGLNFMHVVQIGKGYTTHENVGLKRSLMSLSKETNPFAQLQIRSQVNGEEKSRYSRGFNQNFRWMLFRPIWPPYVDWDHVEVSRMAARDEKVAQA